MSVGVIIHVLTLPKSGSIGGRAGISRLDHAISPRAAALSLIACHTAADPPAVFMPSFAARARNTAATHLPNPRAAARALRVAFPEHRAALRRPAAFKVSSSE